MFLQTNGFFYSLTGASGVYGLHNFEYSQTTKVFLILFFVILLILIISVNVAKIILCVKKDLNPRILYVAQTISLITIGILCVELLACYIITNSEIIISGFQKVSFGIVALGLAFEFGSNFFEFKEIKKQRDEM